MKRNLAKLGRGFVVLAGIGMLFSSMDVQADTSVPGTVGHCEVTGCGSNTPVLFGTPIIGLNLRGTMNRKGVVLDPILQRVRPLPLPWPVADCPSGAVLGVQEGRLVGKTADGRIACDGYAMLGMTFGIEVGVGTQSTVNRVKVTVRISESSQVSTWESPSATVIPTYRLVWHDVSAAVRVLGATVTEGDSICPKREAWMEPWQMIVSPNVPIATRKGWKEATDHLLVVQGETYKDDGSVDSAGKEWFNFACVGSSIAKMRLLGFDPIRSMTDAARAERQATLKMLTGRYLAGESNPSYTSAGMPLLWKHHSGRRFEGEPHPDRLRTDVIEAYWGANGAVCVKHRRTWRRKALLGVADDAEAINVAMPEATDAARRALGARYLPAESRSLSAVRATSTPCPPPEGSYHWTTYPVDHVSDTP